MAGLIIGHADHQSVKIWIQGDRAYRRARITLRSADKEADPDEQVQSISLGAGSDFTGVVRFRNLKPQTGYTVTAGFRLRAWPRPTLFLKGRFQTFPESGAAIDGFSFILGSCNLSTIKVNNLLGLVAGLLGQRATSQSLRRKPKGRFKWIHTLWRRVLQGLSWLVTLLVNVDTGFRQSGTPLLSSPFLRLSELFDNTTVYFKGGLNEPAPGCRIYVRNQDNETKAAGTLIESSLLAGQWERPGGPRASGTLLLTDLEGSFDVPDEMAFDDPDDKGKSRNPGTVAESHPGQPAFMIHAGDQIYFDFPFAHRRPMLEEYRRCYRQAWFEDDWAQNLFSRCPHYMAIDDHEIADNYASDFEPRQPRSGFRAPNFVEKVKRFFKAPEPKRKPQHYLVPALQAYREYVHCRNPDTAEGKYYYEFCHGETPFFVLDTRTERYMHADPDKPDPCKPGMIGKDQLDAFEAWLKRHKDRVKFVVSSVPFVAQVRATSDEGRAYRQSRPDDVSLDKWSGTPFNSQREKIIDIIHDNEIHNLVILAGDVHCCYHATMRIGHPHVTATIHELASGPIYQLRTGNRSHFFNIYEGETGSGCAYRSQIEQLHGGASAAMSIRLDKSGDLPRIDWEVIRTISPTKMKSAPVEGSIILNREPPDNGRI